jgi:hypothetical protein
MHPARFDDLVRSLAIRHMRTTCSRRQLLQSLAGVVSGSLTALLRSRASAARRKCRNGKVACEPGGCRGTKQCVTNLRDGKGQPDQICCCPTSVFDPSDPACCPNSYVCRVDPLHPETDQCCDPKLYTCLPGSGCCRTENVVGSTCREDCCNGSCCAENHACCAGVCCGAGESCCDRPDGSPVCGFCIRTIRIRG